MGIGRRAIAALLAAGSVRVNGRPAKKGTLVRAGDEVTIRADPPALPPAPATSLALLHVDADLVAIDKPPGVPTAIGVAEVASVASALLVAFPEMAAIDRTRTAGLVHRLDTGTSGLLIAARNVETYARLRAAFAAKAVEKEYLALVTGRVRGPRTVDAPLARPRRSRKRMVVARDGMRAWPARTEVDPLFGDDDVTLVRLRMRSGVTHQLRLHLASIGHPIIGDARYGDRRVAGRLGSTAEWHCLHARAVAFDARDLPALRAPFPQHWRPLLAARAWPTDVER